MIAHKYSKLGQIPDNVCRDICGKAFNELRGQDAHMVIQKLMEG